MGGLCVGFQQLLDALEPMLIRLGSGKFHFDHDAAKPERRGPVEFQTYFDWGAFAVIERSEEIYILIFHICVDIHAGSIFKWTPVLNGLLRDSLAMRAMIPGPHSASPAGMRNGGPMSAFTHGLRAAKESSCSNWSIRYYDINCRVLRTFCE